MLPSAPDNARNTIRQRDFIASELAKAVATGDKREIRSWTGLLRKIDKLIATYGLERYGQRPSGQ